MRRSSRLLAGIFALVAMTFSVAETVWASTCAPMMDMQDSAASAHQGSGQDHMPGMPGQPGAEDGDASDCPFSPATTAQNCSATASLPARGIGAPPPAFGHVAGVLSAATRQDLLLETALFHPPRA